MTRRSLVAVATFVAALAHPSAQSASWRPTIVAQHGMVDKDRNMVSLTSSLLSGFGSGMVVEGAGFFLNDRMRYFWLEPDDVNSLQPHKRVRQTSTLRWHSRTGSRTWRSARPAPTRSRRRSSSSF